MEIDGYGIRYRAVEDSCCLEDGTKIFVVAWKASCNGSDSGRLCPDTCIMVKPGMFALHNVSTIVSLPCRMIGCPSSYASFTYDRLHHLIDAVHS